MTVPGAANGSRTSGPGFVVVYDNRDGVYESRKGNYLELVWHHQSQADGKRILLRTFSIRLP
jgi:hypothetical protein